MDHSEYIQCETYKEQLFHESAKSLNKSFSELEESEMENESSVSDTAKNGIELNFKEIIEPDFEPAQKMGSLEKEVNDDDIEISNYAQIDGMNFFDQGKYIEAINAFTKAILSNPRGSDLFTDRGRCYLELKKPNACIRDCTRALQINPDKALAYKLRGRSHGLLGNFVEAAEDLRMACRMDFDEEADDWLREVTLYARKIEENQRKSDMKKFEMEIKEIKERTKKIEEELLKRDLQSTEEDMVTWDLSLMDDTVIRMILDMDIRKIVRDPEIKDILKDTTESWQNLFKYLENPKVKLIFEKMAKIFAGKTLNEIEEISSRTKQLLTQALHSKANDGSSETVKN